MSQAVQETRDALLTKLYAQINEEKVLKDLTSIQLSRIKLLDDLAEEIKSSGREKEIRPTLEENLAENPESLVSRYLLGLFDLAEATDLGQFRSLLEDFRKHAKWTIVDHIADLVLAQDENNRTALRAKVDSTERLKGKKELRPYLERLATVDRKNPDIVLKYALSILEEDKPRALTFLKQAGETYARIKDYRGLGEVWNLIVAHDHKDLPFFERIERTLVGNREKTRAAAYLTSLVEPYRTEENWSAVIVILKKILEYEPASTKARSDLVRAYRAKYETHSLLNEFLKLSDLTNNKKPVGSCIAQFERNIVFDKGNYVYHRSRGVGKITEIDKDQVIIDFRDNPGVKMSIQMAISSLQPLNKEHIWVRQFENPGEIEEILKEDVPLFFEILMSSFGHQMLLADIKREVAGRFVKPEDWSKWWSSAREKIKNDPRFGFNPRKKDELVLRDTPMTLSEELALKFQSATEWDKKLELGHEALKSAEAQDALDVSIQYFREQEGNKDALKRIHAFLFLEAAAALLGGQDEIQGRKLKKSDIQELIKKETPAHLVKYCADTPVVDFKRDLVNLIVKNRDDADAILGEIIFEVPIKINRHVLAELNRMGKTDALQAFLKKAFSRYREHPEIFLWVARSILQGQWDYPWITTPREEVMLLVFRLLKPLVQIEKKGTRLKNSAVETLFGTTNINQESIRKGPLPDLIRNIEMNSLRKMTALFREVPFIPDAHKDNFLAFIKEIRSDFTFDSGDREQAVEETVALLPDDDEIVVSEKALEARRAYLDNLINVELSANSKDIGEAQALGDLRENAEYKAAMERQSQLQAEITRVSDEVKRARIIDRASIRTDIVTIGSKVKVKTPEGESVEYAILGPWDADAEKNVISYMSPLGKSLIGKKVGEAGTLEGSKKFTIESIAKAI